MPFPAAVRHGCSVADEYGVEFRCSEVRCAVRLAVDAIVNRGLGLDRGENS